ncbi:MAG: hypothetical protein ACI4IX_08310 [Acutalibacteraceae bacterium]
MDFEKIKPAVEDITLSEAQKQAIIAECAKAKKKTRAPIYAVAAAAAVIIIVAASPGFLLRAGSKSADSAGNMDEYCNNVAESTATGDFVLFEADGYADIYSVIPAEFVSIVDYDEFTEWSGECTAEGGMALFQFVEHFQIPKEDFEAARAEYSARKVNVYSDTESESDSDSKDEQPAESINSELIYSFDKEKIDEYYKNK